MLLFVCFLKKCVREDLFHRNKAKAFDKWKFTYNLHESVTFFENSSCILQLKNLYHKHLKKQL